jgi:hypothetical protein
LRSGELSRKSPKNLSIVRGLYDDQGGFIEPEATIEGHLARIESAAATAIKKFAANPIGNGVGVPSEIWRFLAWQAVRTPGWMEFLERWIRENPSVSEADVVEPPPSGFKTAVRRERPICLEDPATGMPHKVTGGEPLDATSRGLNALIAISASAWIAGPTREVVQRALCDRAVFELGAGHQS